MTGRCGNAISEGIRREEWCQGNKIPCRSTLQPLERYRIVITVLPPSSDVCCMETAGICGIMPGIDIDIVGMPRLVRLNCASVDIIPLLEVAGVCAPVVDMDEIDDRFDIGIEEKG